MRLKKLQLHGFKTFADKTEIEFAEGVTAIVGPNGSGKSNVGDGILWVLGEQKASAVRGTKASDVIFAGSDGRRPMGMAEVSLTVDNADGTLPVAFNEVTITRRAYRTGEGEYFINKTPCRLKDIYELFLDTGVGREAYSLVNQGQIDAVLSVNAEDRRGLFEEAAGIKKYRVKKREALRKLEAVEVNLNRVRDIQSEIIGRVEPLRVQAERAQTHAELKGRLRAIESGLLLRDVRLAQAESDRLASARDEGRADAARLGTKLAAEEERARDVGARFSQAENALETARRAASEAAGQAERAESGRALAAQRAEGLERTVRQIAGEREELTERRARLARQVADLEAELTDARTGEAAQRREAGARQGELSALSERITGLTKLADRRRAEAALQARRIAAQEADAARAQTRVAELEAGLPSVRAEIARTEAGAGEGEAEVKAAREAAAAAKAAVAEAEQKLGTAQAARDAARQASHTAGQKAQAAQSAAIALSTRLRTLQELEAAQEGYFAGVKAVFEARKRGDLRGEFTVVADSFQTPGGYETALETALSASLQDIITDTEAAAKAAIGFLHDNRAGRATFLPLDRMRPGRDTLDISAARGLRGVLGAALEVITFDPKYRPALEVLLGRVFFCETLDDALRASTAAKGWNRVVTLTGELVLPTGALSGGRQAGRTANILGRKTEIARLGDDLSARERDGDAAKAERERADLAREAADATQAEAQSARQSAQSALAEAGRRADRAAGEARRAEDARAAGARRLESAEATLALAREQAARADAALESAGAATHDADLTEATDTDALAALTGEREGVQAALTQARISLATVGEKAVSLDRALRGAKAEGDGLLGSEDRRARQAREAADELTALTAQAQAREAEVVRARAASAEAANILETQAGLRRALLHESHEVNAAMRSLGESRARALDTLHKAEVAGARVDTQRDTLAARLWDDYEISLESALAGEGPELESGDVSEVARLRRDLRALGDVNPAAIDEYEEVRTRHEFLLTQAADLEESRAKLLAAIHEIDEGTRGVFLETFHAVAAAFDILFTRLFGGGKTELVLTTPDDILETGVDILVQPPGKKRQNLALLSGGERALTAAALLFAFLTVKPSPFCVLDEVDAPLDGANVERFTDLLREFGQKSQMIVITHNPTTMEAAPVWYGVTMQQPGISRILGMQVPTAAS